MSDWYNLIYGLSIDYTEKGGDLNEALTGDRLPDISGLWCSG